MHMIRGTDYRYPVTFLKLTILHLRKVSHYLHQAINRTDSQTINTLGVKCLNWAVFGGLHVRPQDCLISTESHISDTTVPAIITNNLGSRDDLVSSVQNKIPKESHN